MSMSHVRLVGLGWRKVLSVLALAAMVVAIALPATAQQSFKTPDEAAEALARAVKSEDPKAVIAVLGPEAAPIISSGDAVADAGLRQDFSKAWDTKHSIAMKGNDTAVMLVGDDDFPVPLPIVRKNDAWTFDVEAGRTEILARRIGRNELDTIQAMLAYVDAQREYADKDRTGAGPGVYARRIISRDGKKDGLYWPANSGDEQSPLGELVAVASAEGYRGGARTPYHGYYFRILTRQGPNADGGAHNYVVDGKMIGGFGLIAWPAEYGNSGIMTFMVNHAGVVYEKDFGPKSARLAAQITSFDPDPTWKKVDISAAK